jgi:CheY-like chemotaxis protein
MLKDRNILIAEDGAMNILVAKKILHEMGVNVYTAFNGQEAINMIKSGDVKFDIILMDIHMPVLDGYKASLQIRDLGITIPIIALTASALDEIKDTLSTYGMTDYIAKPIERDSLKSKILKYLVAA